MTTLYLKKINNTLIPADEISTEIMDDIQVNTEYKAELTRPRNLKFHRLFFALVKVAFDAWDMPKNTYQGVKIEKNLDRFRKDLLIMAGYGYPVVNIKGDVRFEAQSMSFGSMDQDEFETLYSRVIDVILGKVLTHYTRDDIDDQVNRILGFC